MKKLELLLVVCAAFAGGFVSQHVWMHPAQADTDAPAMVRAQSFVLVDASGKTTGFFGFDPKFMANPKHLNPVMDPKTGSTLFPAPLPSIVLLDRDGSVGWRTTVPRPQPIDMIR